MGNSGDAVAIRDADIPRGASRGSKMKTISEFRFSDMTVRYTVDENQIASFYLLPADAPVEECPKQTKQENMVQLHITGDIYNEAYAGGISMRCGETARCLCFDKQEVEEKEDTTVITTYLKDQRGYDVKHIVTWEKGAKYLLLRNEFTNSSQAPVTLEMLSSFSLSGLTPYIEGDAYESMDIYRIRSVWSGEGRLHVEPLEDVCLEKSWGDHAVRSMRYGVAGSMPVNGFFPFGAVYDKKNHIFWGAQIAHNASWQMEFYRKDEGLSFSGGLADREFGHWMKSMKPGERFETPTAILSTKEYLNEDITASQEFDEFTQRMTSFQRHQFDLTEPASEKNLPIVFNEYCTTWGVPSQENIENILQAIHGKGFSYFVIDAGWYKQEGIPWDKGMGEYKVSDSLFPDGLQHTVHRIKEEGLKPGLWFEIENVASEAKVYQMSEHLLHRDGEVLTSYFRRFWDMSDPWVNEYLSERVIGTLKKYGFEYMKIDYNETVGIGCDGEDSLGENLRKVMEASFQFIQKVKKEIPGIILENCSSGGHRLEPKMMSTCSMASFSDAHECIEIPIIAANLHRVIHPAQSQIWAVIRKTDSLRRITYSLAATMLGRMCLSGDVTELSPEQWDAIDNGIAFYKETKQIIYGGVSVLHGAKIKSMRHPRGWQAVVRSTDTESLIVVHTFDQMVLPEIEIPIHKINEEGCCISLDNQQITLSNKYSAKSTRTEIKLHNNKVVITALESFEAVALHLQF